MTFRRGARSMAARQREQRMSDTVGRLIEARLEIHRLITERDEARAALTAAEARIAAVLDLHQPESRYQPHPDAEWSVSTAEEAADFDEIDIGDVTHFTVCRHCGQIEMRDDDDGRDYLEALWPCPTVRALTGQLDNSGDSSG